MKRVFALAFAASLTPIAARAAGPADFYRGKAITIVSFAL